MLPKYTIVTHFILLFLNITSATYQVRETLCDFNNGLEQLNGYDMI